jgi:hypothetical protein
MVREHPAKARIGQQARAFGHVDRIGVALHDERRRAWRLRGSAFVHRGSSQMRLAFR